MSSTNPVTQGTGKCALISGASRGIGRAIALRLAQLGYNLFLLARDEKTLTQVADEAQNTKVWGQSKNIEAHVLAGELTDDAYVDAAVSAARSAFGSVDVLVNNAGTALGQAAQDADVAAWRRVMDLNFHAAVALSQRLLPEMIERRSGAVINISSISGRSTNAGSGIYCATKHALNGYTECMYEDVRDFGIKVSSIMPGFVSTDLTEGMGMQADKMIRPDDVADSVQYVLSASSSACPTEIVLRPQFRP